MQMFPVCLSVALLRGRHIILQEDVWRQRPRNTVAIVSHFSSSVLIENTFPLTRLLKYLIHFHKPTFPLNCFSSKRQHLCFYFIFLISSSTPCQKRATFDRCRHGSTGMQYRKCKCKLEHTVEHAHDHRQCCRSVHILKMCVLLAILNPSVEPPSYMSAIHVKYLD